MKITIKSAGAAAAILFLIWLSYGLSSHYLLGSKSAEVGDSFGGFNALFSALASLGVIAAIFLQREQIAMQSEELRLQRKELELQRLELALTRKELARSAHAQEETERVLSEQLEINVLAAYLSATVSQVQSWDKGGRSPAESDVARIRNDLWSRYKAFTESRKKSSPTEEATPQRAQ